jgi:hypothetical protein
VKLFSTLWSTMGRHESLCQCAAGVRAACLAFKSRALSGLHGVVEMGCHKNRSIQIRLWFLVNTPHEKRTKEREDV